MQPGHFNDYELLDFGAGQKLERFGEYILTRPEPLAIGRKKLPYSEWDKFSHAIFEQVSHNSGNWIMKKEMPDHWHIFYPLGSQKLKLKIALTSFKHVGIFPEQALNWDLIFQTVRSMHKPSPKILNLFAYTGASSLAAKAAGADVTHLDSIKQVITWARENMDASSLADIRWVVDDAITYLTRASRKSTRYQGIIMDPPAFGRGPKGQIWKFDDHIQELVHLVISLLDPNEHFLIMNTYSQNTSSDFVKKLFQDYPHQELLETGEMFIQSKQKDNLPVGVYAKIRKV